MKKRKFLSLVMSFCVAAMALLPGCSSSTGENGELNVFVWTEYVSDEAISAFEQQTGIKVNLSTFSSNEEMLAKLKSEAEGTYDIVLPSDYMVESLIAQDMLEPIDVSTMDNLSNINPVYLDQSFDPGNQYSVPYQGGVAAIAVNTAVCDVEITSYEDLFNPDLAGQLVVLDDFRAVIGITAKTLGYSMSETDPAILSEIEAKLLTLENNVALYDSDSPKTALISGDASVGMVWSAEIALAMEENPDIEIVYPTEGCYLFLDNWCIPKGASNYDNACTFMNFMMSEEAAVMNLEAFPYLTANMAALDAMGAEYIENEAKNPSSEVVAAGEFCRSLDAETLTIYDEMWTELKG